MNTEPLSRQSIVNVVAANPGITCAVLSNTLNAPYTQISHILSKMCDKNVLVRMRQSEPGEDGKRAVSTYRYSIPKPVIATTNHTSVREQLAQMTARPPAPVDPLDVLKGMSLMDIKRLRDELNKVFA